MPQIIVFSSLFPHAGQSNGGLFVRERMFRVGQHLPLVVVCPIPWFPFQGIIRRFRPHFRPKAPQHEFQQGFHVYFPRFFSIPGFLKCLDGLFMALGTYRQVRRLVHNGTKQAILDAHWAYPDGYAATLIGKRLRIPVTITLRGNELSLARSRIHRRLMLKALGRAQQAFSVADALKQHMVSLGANENKILVVSNGVDTEVFSPISRDEARRHLGLPNNAQVLVSVGHLVERKGFHRVIQVLPALRKLFPNLYYLLVGGGGPAGDMLQELELQVRELGLQDTVRFFGPIAQRELRVPLSAANVFVLATRSEGWANVFLEAMACGLPIVTTDVGGNREVVCNRELGTVVPFGDPNALLQALTDALRRQWDRDAIIAHARKNTWDSRVSVLVAKFAAITDRSEQHRHNTGSAVIRKAHQTTGRSY